MSDPLCCMHRMSEDHVAHLIALLTDINAEMAAIDVDALADDELIELIEFASSVPELLEPLEVKCRLALLLEDARTDAGAVGGARTVSDPLC